MSCFPMRHLFQSRGHDEPNDGYAGSRRLQQRYEYSDNSRAAFVECIPSWQPTPEKFKSILEHVRGVEKVVWQISKTAQNNSGSHYSERNMFVYSLIEGPGSASRPVEFELTRHQHMRGPRGKSTVTAMFKEPPEGLLGEAWRILLTATKD